MTDVHNIETHWFERACRYAELLASIRAWLDATQTPNGLSRPLATAPKAVTEIRRLVDQFDKQQAANPTGGDRP